ncbi:MAG: hypothetical protein LBL71_01215, partial [Endomicrobium sp.]|nr:hypothetical protein [Endomicrobium sp.]
MKKVMVMMLALGLAMPVNAGFRTKTKTATVTETKTNYVACVICSVVALAVGLLAGKILFKSKYSILTGSSDSTDLINLDQSDKVVPATTVAELKRQLRTMNITFSLVGSLTIGLLSPDGRH